MALTLFAPGRRVMLAKIVPYLNTLTIRLFCTDYWPTVLTTEADLVEPTFDGYAGQRVKTFGTVYLAEGNRAESDASTYTWTVGPAGGTDAIYGYWFTDSTGHAIFGERFPDGPVPAELPGQLIRVKPRFLAGALQ